MHAPRASDGLQGHLVIQDGVQDQHVREPQCDARIGDGRAEAADQVRGSLALAVHGRTVRRSGRRSGQMCRSRRSKRPAGSVAGSLAKVGVGGYSLLDREAGRLGTRSRIYRRSESCSSREKIGIAVLIRLSLGMPSVRRGLNVVDVPQIVCQDQRVNSKYPLDWRS